MFKLILFILNFMVSNFCFGTVIFNNMTDEEISIVVSQIEYSEIYNCDLREEGDPFYLEPGGGLVIQTDRIANFIEVVSKKVESEFKDCFHEIKLKIKKDDFFWEIDCGEIEQQYGFNIKIDGEKLTLSSFCCKEIECENGFKDLIKQTINPCVLKIYCNKKAIINPRCRIKRRSCLTTSDSKEKNLAKKRKRKRLVLN